MRIFFLEAVIERVPFGETRVLLLEPLLARLKVRVLDTIHARIGLEHERLQDTLVLDGFTG